MSWMTRPLTRAALVGGTAAAIMALAAPVPALAADEYVMYYKVTAAESGGKQSLAGLAGKFLGDEARSAEVYNLNTGRKQPGGGTLSDPAKLTAGWMLVLPWDAAGQGVEYGVLPDGEPKEEAQVVPRGDKPGKKPTAAASPPKAAPVTPAAPKATSPAAAPAAGAKPKKCVTPAASGASAGAADWAGPRLAAAKAWPQSRGQLQMVAIVDSGVDGDVKQLTGHLTPGSDVTAPGRRGDVDCAGTGTAMASLVAGQGSGGQAGTGIAPDATVMPVRVVSSGSAAQPAHAMAAIQAAVAAGATVIAVGDAVDTSDPSVIAAVTDAAKLNISVVVGAPSADKPATAGAQLPTSVLRVAGVGPDNQPAANYRKGSIDVVAPGVNVRSIGVTGPVSASGTRYAVALAAGEAALIRRVYPELTAEQVAHRVKATADRLSGVTAPDAQFGYGMVNLSQAVTRVLPEEAAAAVAVSEQHSTGGADDRITLLWTVASVATGAAILLVFRIRKLLRAPEPEAG
jgi:membrane-anchored mycosin MYCP